MVDRRPVRPDRGGNSPGRSDQPRAAERGPARDGRRRRGPLPAHRQRCRNGAAGLPGAGQVRRRPRRLVPHRAAGRTGQGAARRVAGAPGPGLQRGQDAHRPPRRGLRLPGVQRPPLPRQAADQTEQGGGQTDPGTAAHRDAGPARGQRAGGPRPAQPDHPGLVGLLPDGGVQRDLHRAGPTTCGSSPTSGPSTVTRTSRSAGSSAATSARSTSPGRTGGCSATATAAPTCSSSPGRRSSGTRWSRARRLPTTRPWPSYWAARRRRGNTPPMDPATPAAPAVTARPLPALRGTPPARRPPAAKPTRMGTVAHGHPQGDNPQRHRRAGGQHPGRGQNSVSYTLTATGAPPGTQSPALLPASEPWGLLEPDAGKLARPVLRGPGRSNAPGLPGLPGRLSARAVKPPLAGPSELGQRLA